MMLSNNYILLLAMIILYGGMLVGLDQVLFVVIWGNPILFTNCDLNSALKRGVKPVVLMVLPQNILFMLTVLLMYFYICYSMLSFGTDIYQLIL